MRRKSAEIEQKIFKEMMSGSRKGVKGVDVNESDKNEDLANKESKPSRFGDIMLQLDYDHSKSDFSVLVMQCHNLLDASSIAKLHNRNDDDHGGETGGLHDERHAALERHSETGSKKKKEDPAWLELDDVPKVSAFVKLCLLPDVTTMKKTKVASRTSHPQFMQKFHFKVAKTELETRRLLVTVWSQQFLQKKSFLGESIIPLQYDNFQEKIPRLYPLRTTETYSLPTQPAALAYRGEISLKICFSTLPGGPDAQSQASNDDEDIDIDEMGTLVVEVQEARSLLNPRKRSCNAHCICALYDVEKQRKNADSTATEVIRKSNNPMWNKRFQFAQESIYALQQKCLEVSVWHNSSRKKKKRAFLGGARLNLATTVLGNGAVIQSPVQLPPWMDARGDESLLWYAVTERPNNWIEATLPLRSFPDDALAGSESGSSEKAAEPSGPAVPEPDQDEQTAGV